MRSCPQAGNLKRNIMAVDPRTQLEELGGAIAGDVIGCIYERYGTKTKEMRVSPVAYAFDEMQAGGGEAIGGSHP